MFSFIIFCDISMATDLMNAFALFISIMVDE